MSPVFPTGVPISPISFVVMVDEPMGPSDGKEDEMTYQPSLYCMYRLEHGLSAAEERAANQHAGEVAAGAAHLCRLTAHNLGRGLDVVRAFAMLDRSLLHTRVAVSAQAGN